MNNLTDIELKQIVLLINDSAFLQGLINSDISLILNGLNIDYSMLSDIELKNLSAPILTSMMSISLTDIELNSIINSIQLNFKNLISSDIKMLAEMIDDKLILNAFTNYELKNMAKSLDDLSMMIASFDDMSNDQFEYLFSIINEILFIHGYTVDELNTFADKIEEGAYWAKRYPEAEAEEIVDMIENLSYTSPLDDPLKLPDWKNSKENIRTQTFPIERDVYNLDNPIYVPNEPNQCFMFIALCVDVPIGKLPTDASNQVLLRYYIKANGITDYIKGEDVVLGTISDHTLYDIGFMTIQLSDSENCNINKSDPYFDGLTNDYLFAKLNKKDLIDNIDEVIKLNNYVKFNKKDSAGNITSMIFTPKSKLLTYINEKAPMLPNGSDDEMLCFPTPYEEDPIIPLDIILYDKHMFNDDGININKLYRTSPVEKYNIDRTSDSSYKYDCIDLGMLYSGFYDTLMKSCSFVKKIDRVIFDPKAFLQLPYFQAVDNMYVESYLLLFNDNDIKMNSDKNWTTIIPERTFNTLLIPFVIENLLLIDTSGKYDILRKDSLNELTYETQFIDQNLRQSGFRSIILDCSPIWTSRVIYDYINIVETLFRKE